MKGNILLRKCQWALMAPVLLFLVIPKVHSSELIEILPLTNRIILLHFDDGSVTYPNTLKVDRLVVADAEWLTGYSFSSGDDADFSIAKNPSAIGRKTKGTEFVKEAPWGGSSFDPRTKPWASEHWIYLVFDQEMKRGKTYTLNTGTLAKNGSEWTFTFDERNLRSEAVHVNTVGYTSHAAKSGYVYQWMGSLGNLDLTAYAGNTYSIYKEGIDVPLKTGVLKKRKSADNPETGQSNDTPDRNFLGAEVYECDFTDITEEGTYKLVVDGLGCSYPFTIGENVLFEAFYATLRGLYHQRSGIRLAPPFSEEDYIRPVNQNTRVTSDDGTSFAGKLLYSDYPFMSWAEGDGGGSSQQAIRDAAAGKTLDVAGWYHDAGDWDSYWTHHRIPPLLMLTYEAAPERFADDELNLPESGNGIPDILDEASWLIKFNYRLRKELMNKGYSDGGVGGARICADVFTSIDGSAESNLPSWKEIRRTVVTQADAFMTYLYAGQAAHFALLLKTLGKDPSAFPVEMLDHVDFDQMSYDTVDWKNEAVEAYAWATAPEHQPTSNNNYSSELGIYRMYAAANLFRLTGLNEYHQAAKTELDKLKTAGSLAEDELWGVYSYLLSTHNSTDKILLSSLKTLAIQTAFVNGLDALGKRACRWGGNYNMPMLVGQATTPWMFESIMAWKLTGEDKYRDAVHTTADYFLGNNPLHSSWITGIGPRPPKSAFHLDSRYNHNWIPYPGMVPYGPWSLAYGYEPYTWVIDGVSMEGGHGPWNKDWQNFSQYPMTEEWPGHERWCNNIHAPMATEFTVHQNTVYAGLTHGFVNAASHRNSAADKPVGSITLNLDSIVFTEKGQDTLMVASLDIQDATFAALKWISSEPRIAHVDQTGRVTAVTSGSCVITCSTLDGSVEDTCRVTCSWPETDVISITVSPDSLTMVEGQSRQLTVDFEPVDASNQFVNWTYSNDTVARVDENGIVKAVKPGFVILTATSLNGGKTSSCKVLVKEAVDYVIADFDRVIPVTEAPEPDKPQLYTPDGGNDIAAGNPLVGPSNSSEKAVLWNRPAGDWRLIGMVLPTASPQDLSQYAQFQFKYYGKDLADFFIQLITSGSMIEINETVDGENAWKLYAYDLSAADSLIQFNIFANKTGNQPAVSFFFDDFKLTGKQAEWFEGISLSDTRLTLDPGDSAVISADEMGQPFSWVSSDESIATIDQDGKIRAKASGKASLKAVPLYGETVSCALTVKALPSVLPVVKTTPFTIAPNPYTTGALKLISPAGKTYTSVRIVDITGQMVFQLLQVSGNEISLYPNLRPGLYFIQAEGENDQQIHTAKLLVQ